MTSHPSPGDPSAAESQHQYPYAPHANVIKPRSVAQTVGLVVACLLVALGLFALAGMVLFVVALNNWGSNK